MSARQRLMVLSLVAGTITSCRGCEDEDRKPVVTPKPKPSASTDAAQALLDAGDDQALPLENYVKLARSYNGLTWAAPKPAELESYGKWVEGIVAAAWSDRLPAEAEPQGFDGRLVARGRVWMLVESPKAKRGAGLLLLRPSGGAPLVIEVPHSFFEPGTLELGLEAFEVLNAKALLVNTVHRGGLGDKAERRKLALSGKSEMDVAHNENSYFAKAHEVLHRVDSGLTTLQLHGFASEKLRGVQVIVSASRTEANTKAMAEALSAVIERSAIRVYPDEIDQLGGTLNVQARISRRTKSDFFHIEMTDTLRERFRSDPEFTRRFAAALAGGVPKPQ